MRKNTNILNASRLQAYSAMAAALTATVSNAHAEVIYTDIDDVTVGVGDEYLVDVDADGSYDFVFRGGSVSTATTSAWSFVSAFGYVGTGTVTIGNAENQFIGYVGSFYNYGSALEDGALIGPEGPWLNYPSFSNSAVLASNFYGSTYGAFPGQGERYLGFKFTVLGNIHYGWMRLEADVDPAYVTIMDFAYEAIPNQAIEAGSLVSDVQELPAGAVNVYSFDGTVFVQHHGGISNATIQITDLQGRTVFAGAINNTTTQIDLSSMATGNYIVQILAGEGRYAKQLYIN